VLLSMLWGKKEKTSISHPFSLIKEKENWKSIFIKACEVKINEIGKEKTHGFWRSRGGGVNFGHLFLHVTREVERTGKKGVKLFFSLFWGATL